MTHLISAHYSIEMSIIKKLSKKKKSLKLNFFALKNGL